MLNNTLIISNNKLVNENLSTHVEVLFSEMTLLETMEKARDLIHKGYKLLTHPLSGSIKPNDTPYKSIALEKGGARGFPIAGNNGTEHSQDQIAAGAKSSARLAGRVP